MVTTTMGARRPQDLPRVNVCLDNDQVAVLLHLEVCNAVVARDERCWSTKGSTFVERVALRNSGGQREKEIEEVENHSVDHATH